MAKPSRGGGGSQPQKAQLRSHPGEVFKHSDPLQSALFKKLSCLYAPPPFGPSPRKVTRRSSAPIPGPEDEYPLPLA